MDATSLVITELAEHDRSVWDGYVKDLSCGLPTHLSGWRDVMSECYGYETHYLMARDGKKVVGVLPLFVVRSVLVGNSAMTMPGGLCADNGEIAQALIDRGREIAHQTKAQKLVLQDTRQAWPCSLHTVTQHEHWVVDTRADVGRLWTRLHRETRRQIRVARKNGLTTKIDRSGERLDEFHQLMSRFAHQIGIPVFGIGFLQRVVEAFPNRFNIAIVYKEELPLGGYFQLLMGNTVYGMWGLTLRQHLKSGAAYLAYWEILRDSAINGYYFWDMGRSPAGSNCSNFKRQWGGIARPVYQQVTNLNGQQQAIGIATRVHSESKFQVFMRLWSQLPFPVAHFLGPKLRRHVPFA